MKFMIEEISNANYLNQWLINFSNLNKKNSKKYMNVWITRIKQKIVEFKKNIDVFE